MSHSSLGEQAAWSYRSLDKLYLIAGGWGNDLTRILVVEMFLVTNGYMSVNVIWESCLGIMPSLQLFTLPILRLLSSKAQGRKDF